MNTFDDKLYDVVQRVEQIKESIEGENGIQSKIEKIDELDQQIQEIQVKVQGPATLAEVSNATSILQDKVTTLDQQIRGVTTSPLLEKITALESKVTTLESRLTALETPTA